MMRAPTAPPSWVKQRRVAFASAATGAVAAAAPAFAILTYRTGPASWSPRYAAPQIVVACTLFAAAMVVVVRRAAAARGAARALAGVLATLLALVGAAGGSIAGAVATLAAAPCAWIARRSEADAGADAIDRTFFVGAAAVVVVCAAAMAAMVLDGWPVDLPLALPGAFVPFAAAAIAIVAAAFVALRLARRARFIARVGAGREPRYRFAPIDEQSLAAGVPALNAAPDACDAVLVAADDEDAQPYRRASTARALALVRLR